MMIGNLDDILKLPNEAVFMDLNFERANTSNLDNELFSFVGEGPITGRYFFTVGDLRSIAKRLEGNKEFLELIEAKKIGFRYLNDNKPKGYETSAEVRNEYDEEYAVYHWPLTDYVLSKCSFEINEYNEFIYRLMAEAVVKMLEESASQ